MENMLQDLRCNHEPGSDDGSEQELVADKTEQSHQRGLRTARQQKPQQPQHIGDSNDGPKQLQKQAIDTRQELTKALKHRINEKRRSRCQKEKT